MADVELKLTLPEKAAARLDHLRTLDGSGDKIEVIRRALAMYDAAVCFVREDGGMIVARDKAGQDREFTFVIG